MVLLFCSGLLPLSAGLATRPGFLYNWEEYTVWKLELARLAPWTYLLDSLRLTDGNGVSKNIAFKIVCHHNSPFHIKAHYS